MIGLINLSGFSSQRWGTTKGLADTETWCKKNNAVFQEIYPQKGIRQSAPMVFDEDVHPLIESEYERIQQKAYIAIIEGARVWGRNGAVITPDDLLLEDVSREFGQYGGVTGKKHSVFLQLKLAAPKRVAGMVAVLASPGANNFHHWLYDNIARIHLLEKAGYLSQVDYFIVDFMGIPFQRETIQRLGIPENKLMICHDNWSFHIRAEKLVVPSLPSRLGVISDWTIEYLQHLFAGPSIIENPCKRFYISRRKAPSRKLVNESALLDFLKGFGFEEYFAEEHPVGETAQVFKNAEIIVGVHGSGLSNLAFASNGIKVLDIVAPRHIDPYYWVITQFKKGTYAYITGEGERTESENDLIRNKVDLDIDLDMRKFETLFHQLVNA